VEIFETNSAKDHEKWNHCYPRTTVPLLLSLVVHNKRDFARDSKLQGNEGYENNKANWYPNGKGLIEIRATMTKVRGLNRPKKKKMKNKKITPMKTNGRTRGPTRMLLVRTDGIEEKSAPEKGPSNNPSGRGRKRKVILLNHLRRRKRERKLKTISENARCLSR